MLNLGKNKEITMENAINIIAALATGIALIAFRLATKRAFGSKIKAWKRK